METPTLSSSPSRKRPRIEDTPSEDIPAPKKQLLNTLKKVTDTKSNNKGLNLTVIGMCISCRKFYGVTENGNRCSHCYFDHGPESYKKIAKEDECAKMAFQKIDSLYGLNKHEFWALLAMIKKIHRTTPKMLRETLHTYLWDNTFLERKLYLNMHQARQLAEAVDNKFDVHNSWKIRRIIFANVCDYWNLLPDDMIFRCSLPTYKSRKPRDADELLEFLEKIREHMNLPSHE